MKNVLSVALVAAALISSSAYASDGQITINGQVIDNTCVINGGAYDKVVTLPTVSTLSLGTVGMTAGDTAFTIPLTSCSASSAVALMHFEAGATVSQTSGNLVNQAGVGASNVEVQLLDGNTFNALNLAGGVGAQNLQPVAIVAGGADINLVARYKAQTGPAVAGPVSTYVTFSIGYN
ncbi:fimbrial protein [Achromobacter marplatensis]|uniref:fimbrial protein n=1 Tax=Achromobacter marplatensis TaxID=470868 RepID=UPI0039F72809